MLVVMCSEWALLAMADKLSLSLPWQPVQSGLLAHKTGDGEGFDFRGRLGEGDIKFSDANFSLECGLASILPSGSSVDDAGAGDETSLQRREGEVGMLRAHAEGGFEVFDNQDIAEKLTRKNRSLAIAFHAIAGTPKDSEGKGCRATVLVAIDRVG